jgi:hypothetical protein
MAQTILWFPTYLPAAHMFLGLGMRTISPGGYADVSTSLDGSDRGRQNRAEKAGQDLLGRPHAMDIY